MAKTSALFVASSRGLDPGGPGPLGSPTDGLRIDSDRSFLPPPRPSSQESFQDLLMELVGLGTPTRRSNRCVSAAVRAGYGIRTSSDGWLLRSVPGPS